MLYTPPPPRKRHKKSLPSDYIWHSVTSQVPEVFNPTACNAGPAGRRGTLSSPLWVFFWCAVLWCELHTDKEPLTLCTQPTSSYLRKELLQPWYTDWSISSKATFQFSLMPLKLERTSVVFTIMWFFCMSIYKVVGWVKTAHQKTHDGDGSIAV